MKIEAYAKINLTLDIVGKRSDGYHDLIMIMQSVGLHDDVTVNLNDSGKIAVKSSSALLADDESNIAYKAAKAFFEYSRTPIRGVEIQIEKNIPMEAGMAGGSADGAAVIFALNQLCGTEYSEETLWKIGVKVGADVPFCITGGTMLSQGKGEILSSIPKMSDFKNPPVILLCKPDIGVSTGKAYAAVDSCDKASIVRPDTEGMKKALREMDTVEVAKKLSNVFEQVLNIDECNAIKSIMLESGALGACMTGSGTTVFGIFNDAELAKQCSFTLAKNYKNIYITDASDCGCKIVEKI